MFIIQVIEQVKGKKQMLKFNEMLRQIRLDKGFSLSDVSQRANIAKTTIHNIESGLIKRPKIEHLDKLSRCYGLNADELVIASGKIPPDVYEKLINNPDLIFKIREI
jgi:transcriptional regulator with XRE-family HTH domain